MDRRGRHRPVGGRGRGQPSLGPNLWWRRQLRRRGSRTSCRLERRWTSGTRVEASSMPTFRSAVPGRRVLGRLFSTTSRPALRAAACGGRPRPAGPRCPEVPFGPSGCRPKDRTRRESTLAFTRLDCYCPRGRGAGDRVPMAAHPERNNLDRLCPRTTVHRAPPRTTVPLGEHGWTDNQLRRRALGWHSDGRRHHRHEHAPQSRPQRSRIGGSGNSRPLSVLPRRLRQLANEARVALDGPHPSPELAPSPPGP
jgi:hypothetical protein